MPVRLAFSLLPFYITPAGVRADLAPPLPELLDKVAEIGFSGVPAEVPEGMTEAGYLSLLSDFGLGCAPGYFQADFADAATLEASVAAAKAIAQSHARLGLNRIFMAARFPDPARFAEPAQGAAASADWLAATIAGLRQVCRAMVAQGVTPCLHPHAGSAIETEAEVEAVLAAIEPGLLLLGPDIGHLAWASINPVAFLARHRARIAALHLKDMRKVVAQEGLAASASYREITCNGLWATPGRGDLDCDGVLDALTGFDGWIVAEIDIPDAETVEAMAQTAFAWAAPRLGLATPSQVRA